MSVRVGINGFGRIGRNIMRAALSDKNIDFVAVNEVSLDIQRGEIFCLLGSSGCGNATGVAASGGPDPSSPYVRNDGSAVRSRQPLSATTVPPRVTATWGPNAIKTSCGWNILAIVVFSEHVILNGVSHWLYRTKCWEKCRPRDALQATQWA